MGLIHVYTGDGKGKTTAAFGLAVRALGRGKRVAVIQFMKGEPSGEIIALTKIGDYKDKVSISFFGKKELVDPHNIKKEDIKEAKRALKEAEVTLKGNYDIVILDEINIALAFGLIDLDDVLKLLEKKKKNTNIILTGRRAHLKIMESADLVTEMRKIKHPFDKGDKAKKGIEY